jgi:hypothetical protein
MPSQRERERYVYIGVSSQVLRHSGGVKDAWFIMFLNELPLGNDQLFEDQRACPNRGVDGALSGGHVWRYIYQSINIYMCVCVPFNGHMDVYGIMGTCLNYPVDETSMVNEKRAVCFFIQVVKY